MFHSEKHIRSMPPQTIHVHVNKCDTKANVWFSFATTWHTNIKEKRTKKCMFCAHLLVGVFGFEYRAVGVVYAETAESRHWANYPYGAVFTFDLLAL